MDLGTPWLAVDHSVAVPPDASHLPERFGLFTLILLGECVIAVMHGVEHQEHWSVPAASSAVIALGIVFLLWWWYFDAARATSERPVRCRRDALRLHAWSYVHLPLYVGIVVAFAGIQLVVSVVPKPSLDAGQFVMLAAALTVALSSLAVVSRMRDPSPESAG
jgi:low temperature requirement protein LtrA